MEPAANRGDDLIAETLRCLCSTLNVGAAMFYWLEAGDEVTNGARIGVPEGLVEHYRREMHTLDPLEPVRLVRQRRHIAELEREAGVLPSAVWRRYRNFLGHYDVAGNMDFVFWAGEGQARSAYAGISLMRLAGEGPFPADARFLSGLYRYIGYTLRGHPRVREQMRREWLRRRIGLTAREIDICELIALGRTNRDIADALGLTLATVKTYVGQIFDKTGAGTRTALAARLAAQRFD